MSPLPPHGALAESLPQTFVQVRQFLLQPGDVGLDARTHCRNGRTQTVLLAHQHGHYLVASGGQGDELLGIRVPQRAHRRTDRLGEMRQHLGIQGIGLGQPAGGSGKIAHLARIDHHHGQGRCRKRGHHGHLQPSGGFQHHCGWSQGLQSGCQVPGTSFVVSHAPSVAARSNAHIQSGLGHVDAHVDWFLIHVSPPRDSERGPSLHDAGLVGPGNCSGSLRSRCGDPRYRTVFHDQGAFDLLHPGPPE